jgi:hypothetical protein
MSMHPLNRAAKAAPSKNNDGKLDAVLKYTKLCEFFQRGACQRGVRCGFAHTKEQLHSQPDLAKTVLCLGFMRRGKCKMGPQCKFAHGYKELRSSVVDESLCPGFTILGHDGSGRCTSFHEVSGSVPTDFDRQSTIDSSNFSRQSTMNSSDFDQLSIVHSRDDKLAKLDSVMADLKPFVAEKNSFLDIVVPQVSTTLRKSVSMPELWKA